MLPCVQRLRGRLDRTADGDLSVNTAYLFDIISSHLAPSAGQSF